MPKPNQQLRKRIADLAAQVEALVASIRVPAPENERVRDSIAQQRDAKAKTSG